MVDQETNIQTKARSGLQFLFVSVLSSDDQQNPPKTQLDLILRKQSVQAARGNLHLS